MSRRPTPPTRARKVQVRRRAPTRRIKPGRAASRHSPGGRLGTARADSFFVGMLRVSFLGAIWAHETYNIRQHSATSCNTFTLDFQWFVAVTSCIKRVVLETFNQEVLGSSPSALTKNHEIQMS